MLRSALIVAGLCVAGCGSQSGGADAGGNDAGSTTQDAGNPGIQQQWLDAHNAERANAVPAPSSALPAMTWSDAAAAEAQRWADRCQFVHNTASGYGENLWAAAGATGVTPLEVVTDWASEKQYYTYSSNSCAAGKACGHYTQVVWRNSTSVGCAMKVCTTNSPFGGSGAWQFWLCDYDPPGNFVGQKPY